jgi:hypothetical protein
VIDNPAEVAALIRKMETHLPIAAKATAELAQLLRDKMDISSKQSVAIEKLIYLGDEGGIACAITLPGGDKSLIVSLTHLRIQDSHPLAKDIVAYQRKRVKKLARESKNY